MSLHHEASLLPNGAFGSECFFSCVLPQSLDMDTPRPRAHGSILPAALKHFVTLSALVMHFENVRLETTLQKPCALCAQRGHSPWALVLFGVLPCISAGHM